MNGISLQFDESNLTEREQQELDNGFTINYETLVRKLDVDSIAIGQTVKAKTGESYKVIDFESTMVSLISEWSEL